MLDGYWSQISWAYASLFAIVAIALSIVKAIDGCWIYLYVVMLEVIMYSYAIPLIANLLMPERIKIRAVDWLCLPLAIALKGIGPNVYLLQRMYTAIVKKEIIYSKVER